MLKRNVTTLLWVLLSIPAVAGNAQSQHHPGEICSTCHVVFKIAGTVFADSSGQRGQPGVPLSLLAQDGTETPLGNTNGSGNIASESAPEGRFLMRLGNIASRSWHSLPQQGMCNSCHMAGGNPSAIRSKRFPQLHTRIPVDNDCRHCHHFPASMSYTQLAPPGVLTNSSPPPAIPVSQVEMAGKTYRFDPSTAHIVSVRPDVFAPGYFSMFDVILAVAKANGIPVEYHFDESRKTHFLTKLGAFSGDYWYHFSFDAGTDNRQEIQYRRANRWDELLWRAGAWIQVVQGEDLEGIQREYLEEIRREKERGSIIPSVLISVNPSSYRGNPPGSGRVSVSRDFRDVAVTAHQIRSVGSRSIYPKPFQPGVVTALDILLSLQDQGRLEQIDAVYYSYFAQHYIESHYVVGLGFPGVGLAHASGRQGFTYVTENGTPSSLPNNADRKLHVTSDILVIHAPDFATWQWTELGNPYYENSEPVAATSESALYLPRIASTATEQTGVAVVNNSAGAAAVSFTAYGDKGTPLTVSAPASNPFRLAIPPRGHIARLLSQLFGNDFAAAGGWMEISSDQPAAAGFFLIFDPRLQAMDGADVSDRLLTRLLFPEIQEAEISLANPHPTQAADAVVRCIDNQGQPAADSLTVRIPPRGRWGGRVRELFPTGSPSGYLFVTSSTGLSAIELFSAPNAYFSALNALDADGGASRLYAPQYVAGGGFNSAVTLVNLENAPTTVSMAWFNNSGGAIGRTVTVTLPARGRTVVTDPGVFGALVPETGLQGYLTISSAPSRIAGAVRFGDPAGERFQTALPLLAEGRREVIYAQAAQNETYFTGLAIVNPNADAAQATVAVFDSNGRQAGSGERVIPAGGRISELLTQIVPGLPVMDGGYFKLGSTVPVISFAVFGTHTLSALSAIPPQPNINP